MRFDILSIFPESFASYFDVSILKRARTAGHIDVHVHNLRDFALDKHATVDDTPYGGGAGMVMKVEPFDRALTTLREMAPEMKTRTILFSAKGHLFTERTAERLATFDRLILLCGRYEGVDERVAEHLVDEEISIGSFVLTGGELPAMVVVDAVSRLLPGVLGNTESALSESFAEGAGVEHPQYTKPEVYRDWAVPPILLSGHHAEISLWRAAEAKKNTLKRHAFDEKENFAPRAL